MLLPKATQTRSNIAVLPDPASGSEEPAAWRVFYCERQASTAIDAVPQHPR